MIHMMHEIYDLLLEVRIKREMIFPLPLLEDLVDNEPDFTISTGLAFRDLTPPHTIVSRMSTYDMK